MIDPKFDRIAVEPDDKLLKEEALLTDEERARRARTPLPRGLSIDDTIAHDADHSVGGRGVDTSGVSAGAGAGAGSTFVTPVDDGSPAPKINPGPRGTGTGTLGNK
jgi:hypothetical protein